MVFNNLLQFRFEGFPRISHTRVAQGGPPIITGPPARWAPCNQEIIINAPKLASAGIALALFTLVGCGGEDVVSGTEPVVTLDQAQRTEIQQLLGKYKVALNAGDVPAVLQVYTTDPVVMTAEHDAAVGATAVQGFYTGTFQAIALDLKFTVAELSALGTDWAMLRSTSTGTLKVNANGAVIPSSFQELFVVRKENGKWKFARYFFSSTLPAAQ